jgi:phosphate transport system substrate-binding protein
MTTQTGGAIGYVEYAYAKQNKMSYALMKNHDGKSVQPEIKSFQAAAANADWAQAEGFYLILTDQSGPASWPITGASFILMHKESADAGPAQTALKFFHWAYEKGDAMAQELDYVPLPPKVVTLVEDSWKKQLTSNGKSIWPAK